MSKYLVNKKIKKIFNGIIPRYEEEKQRLSNLFIFDTYSAEVTMPANGVETHRFPNFVVPTGYTFVGFLTKENGYGDQWTVTYSIYDNRVCAKIKNWYNGQLTAKLNCTAMFVKSDYLPQT